MINTWSMPRLVLAGTASGVGKTTFMVGLIGALRERGLKVAVFKCGPDYLDPSYHKRAADRTCHNLDGWLMGREAVLKSFELATQDADIALIEGVMGLYDGASPSGEHGSTAEIAKWLAAPVVLCCDASGMARSIAALVQGFKDFDPELQLAGAIANRVGSTSHLELLKVALQGRVPLFGGLPKQPELSFSERYLGLEAATSPSLDAKVFKEWASLVSSWCDLDQLLLLARSAPPLLRKASAEVAPQVQCRLGVAWDAAFDFYYPDNLAQLEAAGAELVYFSPLRDHALPAVDGLYFGGGYPEVYARELSANQQMRTAIQAFAEVGGPVYAECGGLIYLSKRVQPRSGEAAELVGLIPGEVILHAKLQALGYVEVETQADSILGGAGTRFRGHQFRYSELRLDADQGEPNLYSLRLRRNAKLTNEGYRYRNVVASYVHAHWASNPRIPHELVASMRRFRIHCGNLWAD